MKLNEINFSFRLNLPDPIIMDSSIVKVTSGAHEKSICIHPLDIFIFRVIIIFIVVVSKIIA